MQTQSEPFVLDAHQRNEQLVRAAWVDYELLNPSSFKVNGAATVKEFVKKLSDGRFLSDVAGFAYMKRHGARFSRPEAFGTDETATADRFARYQEICMALRVNSDYILSQDVIPQMRIDMVAGNLTELVAIAKAGGAAPSQTPRRPAPSERTAERSSTRAPRDVASPAAAMTKVRYGHTTGPLPPRTPGASLEGGLSASAAAPPAMPARAPSPSPGPGAPYVAAAAAASSSTAAGASGGVGGFVAGVLSSLTRPSRAEDLSRCLSICESELANVRTENKALTETVQALRQCAEEAGAAQTASLAAQHAAIEEKKALAAELQSARDEVAAILGSSRSIQAQLGDASGAMQVLQGKVDSMTAERDGLTARISRADADLQKLKSELKDQVALFSRIQDELSVKTEELNAQIAQHATETSSLRETLAAERETHSAETAAAQAAATATQEALQVQVERLQARIATLQGEATAAEQAAAATAEGLRGQLTALQASMDDLRAEAAAADAAHRAAVAQFAAQASAMDAEVQAAKADALVARRQLGFVQQELASFRGATNELRDTFRAQLSSAASEFSAVGAQLASKVALAEAAAREANRRYISEQAERRRLHTKLQEARGNIRVICRVRPVLPKELEAASSSGGAGDAGSSSLVLAVKPTTQHDLVLPEAPSDRQGGRMQKAETFEFDRVFGPESTQAAVFDEVQPMVISAIDGFYATIFAYGQTGSGKTHTMEGGAGESRGIYSRALHDLFSTIRARSKEAAYSVRVSMVEIYNENIIDLLSPTAATTAHAAVLDAEEGQHSLEVRQGPSGNFLPAVTTHTVEEQKQVEALMAQGAHNRTVGCTQANERSSRSHSLLMVDIAGQNLISGVRTLGRLVLVDLAGSERVAKSGAEGTRLKEAQSINKSLSALGDVVAALATKAGHVPLRNSKLTWLLADSLSKDSTSLMIVQVSPLLASRSESLCSLQFASRARRVELGKASARLDGGAEAVKAKAELKKALDGQRAVVADLTATKAAAAAASEAEATARARATELASRVSSLERDAAAAAEVSRELESVRGLLRAEREIAGSRAEEVDRLKRELKEQVAKAAAGGAASSKEAIAAAKRAAEEERQRAHKAVAAEEARAAEAAKTIAALKQQLTTAASVADARVHREVEAAVAAARISWDRSAAAAATAARRTSSRPSMAAGVGAVATIAGVRRVIDEVRSFATAPQPVAMPQSAPQDGSEGGAGEVALPGPSAVVATEDVSSDATNSSSPSEGTFVMEQPAASQAATTAMSLDDLAPSSSTTEGADAASQAAATAAPPIIQGLAESYSGLTTTDRIDTALAAGEVVFSTPDVAAPGVVFNMTPETSGTDSKSVQSKRRSRGSSTGSVGASKRHPTPFRKSAAPDTAAAVEDDEAACSSIESSIAEAAAPETALLNSGLLATGTAAAAPSAGLEASSSEGMAGPLPGSAAYRRLLRTAGLPTPKPVGILKRRAGIPAAAGSDAKDSKDADTQAAPGALKRGRAAAAHHHVSLVSPTTDAVTLPGHSDDSRRARPAPGTPVVTESAASDKPTAADPEAIAPAQSDAAERVAPSEPPAAALRPASAHTAKGRSTRGGAAPQPSAPPAPLPRSLSPGASALAGAALATRTGRVLRTGKAAAVVVAELPEMAQETSAGTKPLAGVKRLHDVAAVAAAPQPPVVVSKKARGGAGVASGLMVPPSLADDGGENSDAAAISQTITSTVAPLVPSKRAAVAAAAPASAGTAGVKPAMAPPARVKASAGGGASRATSVLSRSGPARVSVTEATSSVLFERQAAAAAERERSSKTWRS